MILFFFFKLSFVDASLDYQRRRTSPPGALQIMLKLVSLPPVYKFGSSWRKLWIEGDAWFIVNVFNKM